MTQFIFANNVNTTLAGAISSSATTLTLASSANLPASIPGGEYFALTLNDAATRNVYEIVYATAVSGATLTVIRAQEGTAAHAWATGDFAFSGPTAGQMASFNTGGSGVTSFNTRTGDVTLSSSDVDTALGYTAANQAAVVLSFNTRQENVVLDSTDVDTALGYTPANDASVVHIAGTETITGAKQFGTGINFGSRTASSNTDLSQHINLYAGVFGFNVTSSGALNIVANGGLYSYSPSGFTSSGTITCTTFNATGSDRRLKRNIRKFKARPLHRSVPFVSYILKSNGWHGLGSIAQTVQGIAPEHVGDFEQNGKKYLSINYAGMAYEQAIWTGFEVDRIALRVAKMERDLALAKIEPRKRGFVRRLMEAIW